MADKLIFNLEDVSLSFGGKPIFEDISVNISEYDKICLVGRNGAGKSTLMKLITGDYEADAGKRFVLKGTKIGYLRQQVEYDDDISVKEFVLHGLPKEERTEDKSYLADMVISPLALDADAKMGSLSGGQVRRAALAQSLVDEPDLLLLDEPTNHLDLGSIEWLEGYLKSYRGALVCVSHDRAFLSNISSKILWIDRGTVRSNNRGYKYFEGWAQELLEQEARTLHNMQKKMESELDWTQGGVSARRKRNMRRMNELHRLREKLKKDKASYRSVTTGIKLDPLESVQASKIIVEFKEVSKSFVSDEGKKKKILDNFNLRMLRGDRVGILGKNGSGKSTFLKLLIGEMQPDVGRIKLGKNVEISYFDQHRSDLNPKKTVWETLCPEGGDYVFLGSGENRKPKHVCGYLKDFLFDPRIANEMVSTLSGGQQNRLMLAKILANPGSVLILDEPTNDLDMDTLDMLQEIIANYEGTLFIVSHDRDFLDRTVTQIIAFEGDGVVEGHVGGYSDYIEAKNAEILKKDKSKASAKQNVSKMTTGDCNNGSKGSKTGSKLHENELKNAKNGAVSAKKAQKLSYKLQYELDNLPKKISDLEAEIKSLQVVLSDADLYMKEPEKFDLSSQRLAEAEAELEESELRWLELDEMRSGG